MKIDLNRDLRKHMLSLNLSVCEFSVYSILLYLSAENTEYFFGIKLEKGQCVISQGRLSERTGCDRNAIRKALHGLHEKGLIEIEPSEKFGVNIYTVCAVAEYVDLHEVLYERLTKRVENGEVLHGDYAEVYQILKNVYGV